MPCKQSVLPGLLKGYLSRLLIFFFFFPLFPPDWCIMPYVGRAAVPGQSSYCWKTLCKCNPYWMIWESVLKTIN